MSDTKWPGTPAEWDAELERRACAIQNESDFTLGDDAVVRWARATMPPRPVEPPSVVTASGWRVTWEPEPRTFYLRSTLTTGTSKCANSVSEVARRIMTTDEELDAIRALRDGPTARYEVCGYEHWRGNKYVQTFHVSDTMTAESCKQSVQFEIIQTQGGGTAHAIYKRVGGA